MRLFVALDIDDAIRERINRFVESVRNFAPDARWMKPESMHVTLKFIGEQPDDAVEEIRKVLAAIRQSPPTIHFRGHGFFPAARSARVFWVGIEAGPELGRLAASIDASLSPLDIPAEHRPYSPHLTLARSAGGSGAPRRQRNDKFNRVFQPLQNQLATLPMPEFGTMTPREFFLYRSVLSPKGSIYTKLARFSLE